MAKITAAIGQQNFELIRTRIGIILADELVNQATLIGDAELNATVWDERIDPFQNAELPAINVQFQEATDDQRAPGSDRYEYRYTIDVNVSAKATISDDGDLAAQNKLQRIIGLIRAILRDTHYKTLDFPNGFIANCKFDSWQIGQPYKGDGNFIAMARMNFVVVATETNNLEAATTASGYDTQVKLFSTDKGYKFTLNN